MKTIANILIQLAWICACIFVGYLISLAFFDKSAITIGIISVIFYFLLWWVTSVIKATKDPDVKAASKFHLTVPQYRKFKTLFDLLLCDEMMSREPIKELLCDILVKKPKEWKTYCLSRENEYKPFYHIGKEVFVRNESNKYTKGVITNISFGIEWWYYTIEFTKPISINNGWPSEKVTLLAKTIIDIETNDIKCDDCHYVF